MKIETPIPNIVIVGPVEDDCGSGLFFAQFPWRFCRVPGCLEFLNHARRHDSYVVICERDLQDGDWKDVLGISLCLRNPPPLIVTSRLADNHLWAEVLNLGGYDVLAKPLDTHEVDRVVTLAWGHAANEQRSNQRPRSAIARAGGAGICSTA